MQVQSQYPWTTLNRFPQERGLLLPEEEKQAEHSGKTKNIAAMPCFTGVAGVQAVDVERRGHGVSGDGAQRARSRQVQPPREHWGAPEGF